MTEQEKEYLAQLVEFLNASGTSEAALVHCGAYIAKIGVLLGEKKESEQ